MASLAEQIAMVKNDAFRQRVAMGMYTVAREVLLSEEKEPQWEFRDQFARTILASEHTQFLKYAALVAADPAITTAVPVPAANNVTDETILNVIRDMWNLLSGVGITRDTSTLIGT